MSETYSSLLKWAVLRKVAGRERPSDMARRLGIPAPTVRGWCYRAGVRVDDDAPESFHDACVRMWALGWTCRRIGIELGKSEDAVTSYVARHRADFPRRKERHQ